MAKFYQHPYEFEKEPRLQKLYQKMWFNGLGIFLYIYKKIRLNKGSYPLDSIMLTAGNNQKRQKQINRVITQFDLFYIENDQLYLKPGLNASDFIRRDNIAQKVQKAAELSSRDTSNDIFPDDARQAYQQEAARLNEEINANNINALNSLTPNL